MADFFWIASSGSVTTGSNWSTNPPTPSVTPPGSTDAAVFENLGGSIVGTITVGEWAIESGAGFYTFAGGDTAGSFQVGANAALTGIWTSTAIGDSTLGVIVDAALQVNSGTVTAAAIIGIGIDDAGSLSETDDASLSALAVVIGDSGTGTLDLSLGSTATVVADVLVGAAASGTLDLSSGASATVSGVLAVGAGGTSGVADIDGASLTDTDQVQVGVDSDGTLIVQGGGSLSTSATLSPPFLLVGENANTGTIIVEGAGSAVNAGGNTIEIGEGGTGVLTIEADASLIAGNLFIAGGGTGTVDVLSGASASVADILAVGNGGSSAVANIDAATVIDQGGVQVGLQSNGTLTIQGGGALTTSASLSDPFLVVGGAGEAGTVTVEDDGSELNAVANQIQIGDGGTGSLTVSGGATLVAGSLIVANGGTGTVDVSGGLSVADIGNAGLSVGAGGTGQLTLEQGATLTDGGGIAVGVGGTGTLNIDSSATLTSVGAVFGGTSATAGSGSATLDAATWLSSGQIEVGANGTGTLNIDGGATLTSVGAAIGGTSSTSGSGSVTLDAATWLSNGQVVVGAHSGGTADLQISGGATLQATATLAANAPFLFIDENVAGHASVTLSGAATVVDAGGNTVLVGNTGSGTLAVDSGARLDAGNLVIAATGTATGSVTLASGGTVMATSLELSGGGTLAIDSTSSGEVGSANDAVAGQLVIDTGSTPGGAGTIAAAVTNHGDLTAQNGTLTVTGQATGAGFYDVAGGAVLDLDQPGDVNLRFDGPTGIAVLGTASGTAGVTNITGNDTIDIIGIGNDAQVSILGDTATVSGSVGSWTFDFGGTPPALLVTNVGMDAEVVACFAEGTLIATPEGEAQVERLSAGDTVVTLRGEIRRIAWVGSGRVLATRGRRNAATPVIVRKGALGPNMPHVDLRITKGHALFVDDVLIPVEFLVNHRSILWDDRAQEVTVYHIELETHDVLVANGAAAESYRDDGNRWLFQNANSGWALPPQTPCAPVLTGGPIVDAVWRRLLDLAGPRPGMTLTGDPDLHVLIESGRLDPVSNQDGVAVFRLPAGHGAVRLASCAAIPAELGLARDARSLGVAVRRIGVRQGTRFRVMQGADAALSDGFHPFEPASGLRWTDGDASLPAALFAGFKGPVELVVTLGATTQYPLFGKPCRAAAA